MNPMPGSLHGLFAVLPTPMVAGGRLDLDSLDRVVDHYLAGGATGLVPASIAGEGHLLDEHERHQVIERVARHAAGRAPVIVGVLDDSTEAALAQARIAADCGACGLLVKPPTGDAAAVRDHVGAIAQALRLPLILIDHPRFGGPLTVDLLQQLADAVPEVCGVKVENEPTPDKMTRVRTALGPRLALFGGLGGVHCLGELAAGADGFFTGFPHPDQLAAVLACWREGDRVAAVAASERMMPVATWEREHPASMVHQRKVILRDAGVIREAVVR